MPTSIQDLIVPEVVGEIASALMVDKTALVNSGVATPDYNNVDIRAGGEFCKVPFWNEAEGEDEVLQEGSALTPDKITMGEDIGVVLHRGKAWSAYTLARIVSGKDPNRAVANQLANFWGKRYDAALLSVLKGVFSGPLKDSHVLDVTEGSTDPVPPDPEYFVDAMALLGDNMSDAFEVIIMHSRVYSYLVKQGFIRFGQTVMGQQVIETGELPTFLGRRVIVSDACPVEVVDGKKKYTTFIAGRGVMYFGFQRELTIETDKDILAQEEFLVTTAHFCAHLKGVKWAVTTTNPDNDALATGSNWQKVWPDKAIRIVALKTN
jgi:hypothetical protein